MQRSGYRLNPKTLTFYATGFQSANPKELFCTPGWGCAQQCAFLGNQALLAPDFFGVQTEPAAMTSDIDSRHTFDRLMAID
ncbi:hypothetical protein [Paraburkholderia sp. RL17-347-BIC-D]|uniref:hypothetical protein n=1 Tax=Paraburkholderia sp. RL17-347-BIC-D TaxID=3031632 RepID=UPI0038BC292B